MTARCLAASIAAVRCQPGRDCYGRRMLAVVLSFDQFPLRLLGCYGDPAVRTPTFNRMAAAGFVFDQHFGEDFSRAPAGHAWWSGCYHFPRAESPLVSKRPSLPRLLNEAGVETRWMADEVSSPLVPCPEGPLTQVDSFADLIHHGTEVVSEWANDDRPRLLWLKAGNSAWETQNRPTEAPNQAEWSHEDWAVYRGAMTACVEQIDGLLEPFWDQVRKLAAMHSVLFLFTASRGMPLGERASMSSSQANWGEESVHLPLLVFLSGVEGGERRQVFTQTLDLPAMLLEFLAQNPQAAMEGLSFLPTFFEKKLEKQREYITCGCDGTWDAIRTQEFHLVRLLDRENPDTPTACLFLKPDDIWDRHDGAAQEPEMTEILSAELDAFEDAAKNQCPLPRDLPGLAARICKEKKPG